MCTYVFSNLEENLHFVDEHSVTIPLSLPITFVVACLACPVFLRILEKNDACLSSSKIIYRVYGVLFFAKQTCRPIVLRQQSKRKAHKEPSGYSCWRKRREIDTEKGRTKKKHPPVHECVLSCRRCCKPICLDQLFSGLVHFSFWCQKVWSTGVR